MKKFINAPENLTIELLEGLQAAYPNTLKLEGKVVVRAKPKSKDKVAVITLGGAGHEPAYSLQWREHCEGYAFRYGKLPSGNVADHSSTEPERNTGSLPFPAGGGDITL